MSVVYTALSALFLGTRGRNVEGRKVQLLLRQIEVELHDTVGDFNELSDEYEQRGLNEQYQEPPKGDQES